MDHRVLAAIRTLENDLGRDVTIAALAASVGLSLHHFHRLFVSQTGETPASFLRRVRLDSAALHLKWTGRTAGDIAYNLGYRSQASFTRAFHARHGATPDHYRRKVRLHDDELPGNAGVVLREIAAFSLVARRYVGVGTDITAFWADFLPRLPPELDRPGRTLYLGRLYDDPRATPTGEVRYDCGIILSTETMPDAAWLSDHGLEIVTTRAGPYACCEHRGPADKIAESYDHLGEGWARTGTYTITDDPALELHVVARCRQGDERRLTLMLPVE